MTGLHHALYAAAALCAGGAAAVYLIGYRNASAARTPSTASTSSASADAGHPPTVPVPTFTGTDDPVH